MPDFAGAMRRALLAVRAQNVTEATRIIQNALAGRAEPAPAGPAPVDITPSRAQARAAARRVDPRAPVLEPIKDSGRPSGAPGGGEGEGRAEAAGPVPRPRRPLGEVLKALRKSRMPRLDTPPVKAPIAPPPVPDGARFVSRSFTCRAGTRPYKLYIPASAPQPRGLILMLHGCKQNPDDFAAGTKMNALAEVHDLAIAYPGQTRPANGSHCWNWFAPANQMRGAGEPAILAGIAETLMAEFGLGREQVFVAGLSAGGAMAAVMSETYPDIFAAVGIHSGLPYGVAQDVVSAFAVMRGEPGQDPPVSRRNRSQSHPRTIVFHGSADQTVHAANADRIVEAASLRLEVTERQTETGFAEGRAFRRGIDAGPDGRPAIEYWLLEGGGHAWSGGSAAGSYTDPQGPDASAEMVRFFLEQPKRAKSRKRV